MIMLYHIYYISTLPTIPASSEHFIDTLSIIHVLTQHILFQLYDLNQEDTLTMSEQSYKH